MKSVSADIPYLIFNFPEVFDKVNEFNTNWF